MPALHSPVVPTARPDDRPTDLGTALAALRRKTPLVHCLTNIVAAPLTANALLAVGASPAMVDNPHEAEGFATVADAVLINLGTPRAETAAAMLHAVRGATAAGTPWVLDPVAVGPLPWRSDLARDLLSGTAGAPPTVLRGNPSEVLALADGGRSGKGGRGVDSLDSPESALAPARALAARLGTVVAVSGAADHLTDGVRDLRLTNGTPLLTQVTGAGCALGALVAAFCAVTEDALLAAAAATATLTVAAEAAAARSAGPGSFAAALLDELAALTPDALQDRASLHADAR